jgi:hypothetical protein
VEAIKERIHYYTEWIRLFWAAMFFVGAGVAGLLLTLDSNLKTFLFVAGMILQVVFAVIIGIIHRRIAALIERLERTQ